VLVSAVILTLPWLACGLMGVSIVRAERCTDRGESFIAFGAGSALSVPLVGSLAWLVLELGASSFSYMLAGLSAVCVLLCGIAILKARPYSWARPTPWQSTGLTMLALQVMSCSWLAISSPLHGWDSLDHWGSQAQLIAEQIEAATSTPKIALHSHSPTVSLVLAWGALVKNHIAQENTSVNTGGMAWVLCLTSIVIIMFGWGARHYQRRGAILIFCYVTASIPLLQNHSALIGYSEIFVTLFVLIATVCGCSAVERVRTMNCTMLVAAVITLLYLRNTGLVYGALILASVSTLLLCKFMKRSSFFLLLLFATIAFAATVSVSGWMLEFRGLDYGFDVESGKVAIANFRHAVSSPALVTITNIFEMALIKNMSFGLLGVATLVPLSRFFFRNENFTYSDKLLLILWISLLSITILSLFLPYGLEHSMPDRDTYLSRSLLPFIVVSMLLVVAATARGVAVESSGVRPCGDVSLPARP